MRWPNAIILPARLRIKPLPDSPILFWRSLAVGRKYALAMQNAHAVHVSNLAVAVPARRGHAKKLLSGINFDLASGHFVGIIGASGCGKSTLIRALAGQIGLSAGRVLFAGHSIVDLKRNIHWRLVPSPIRGFSWGIDSGRKSANGRSVFVCLGLSRRRFGTIWVRHSSNWPGCRTFSVNRTQHFQEVKCAGWHWLKN